jgi:hypothetical protein
MTRHLLLLLLLACGARETGSAAAQTPGELRAATAGQLEGPRTNRLLDAASTSVPSGSGSPPSRT